MNPQQYQQEFQELNLKVQSASQAEFQDILTAAMLDETQFWMLMQIPQARDKLLKSASWDAHVIKLFEKPRELREYLLQKELSVQARIQVKPQMSADPSSFRRQIAELKQMGFGQTEAEMAEVLARCNGSVENALPKLVEMQQELESIQKQIAQQTSHVQAQMPQNQVQAAQNGVQMLQNQAQMYQIYAQMPQNHQMPTLPTIPNTTQIQQAQQIPAMPNIPQMNFAPQIQQFTPQIPQIQQQIPQMQMAAPYMPTPLIIPEMPQPASNPYQPNAKNQFVIQ